MLWLKWSVIITYADDTSTSVSGASLSEVISKLEEDACSVLRYMASNGLVANATKTTFLIINSKSNVVNTIKIGQTEIKQEKSAKLLGMNFTDDLQWKEHIEITIKALNRRLFLISRLRNKLNNASLRRIADSIFNSKIRYGLQLCGKVRTTELDPKQGSLMAMQKVQNKLFRVLNNSSLKDRIRTKSIANELNMLSVNQINAQVKLTEIWKTINVENYPHGGIHESINLSSMSSRSSSRGDLQVKGKTELRQSSFVNDAANNWNTAPNIIKQSKSLFSAKKEIKKFVQTLPI